MKEKDELYETDISTARIVKLDRVLPKKHR